MPQTHFNGIIDVYGDNSLKKDAVLKAGVAAILHKATEGHSFQDKQYKVRKEQFHGEVLWGAYHLTNGASPREQLENFLSVENGEDPRVLMALDWEESADGTVLDLDGIRELITLFHQKLGRFPMLYGGHMLRDSPEVILGDKLLANCPLWYQRYRWEPKALPVKTWPTYTLWQFADEKRGFGAPVASVIPGADFNRFQGTEAELRAAWPFAGSATPVPLPEQPPALPRRYLVTASSLNLREGPGIDHEVSGILHKGETLSGAEFNADRSWIRVTAAGGKEGWCSLRWLTPVAGTVSAGEPAWMPIARGELGVKEIQGSGDAPRIAEYLQSTSLGSPENRNDETPWCSAFVNWCMEEAQIEGTNSAWARDWLKWGKRLETPVPGCVTVFSRGSGGHVAFFVEERKDEGVIRVLGGNQHDCVCIADYDASHLLGYRMNA